MREIGTGQNQRIAERMAVLLFVLNHLCQRHTQRAAALVTLVAHHDGHKLKAAKHLLQPRQFHFDGVLAAR